MINHHSLPHRDKRFLSFPKHLGWLGGPLYLLFNRYWGLVLKVRM
jgi:hypothetical protein